MKIRNGFVSNSSSSSFVVSNNMTTAQVATIMLYGVKRDHEKWAKNSGDVFVDGVEKAISWLESNQQFDEPIAFPWTINYETFIWRDGNRIYVDTCNNQSEYWELLSPTWVEDYSFPGKSGITFLDLDTMTNISSGGYYGRY